MCSTRLFRNQLVNVPKRKTRKHLDQDTEFDGEHSSDQITLDQSSGVQSSLAETGRLNEGY